MPRPKRHDRDVYTKCYGRCKYRAQHQRGLKPNSNDYKSFMRECMEECEREQQRKPPLTEEEKRELIDRKFRKIELEDALERVKQEQRGRERFPPIYLPESLPTDFFKGEKEKSGHEKLTDIMEKTESGMEYTRLMRLIDKLRREEEEENA